MAMSFDRPLPPNPFRRPPGGRPPSSEDLDRKRREKQLKLGVLWTERKIDNEKLQKRHVRLSQADIDRYAEVRKEQTGMKGSEEPGWTEWMFLEGADSQGGVTRGKYEWFGDSVLAYNPNKIDDVLHRTDAILLFLDEEDERSAYPVAVDVVSFNERYPEKFRKDMDRMNPRNLRLSSAYWIDTESDVPGEAIDAPKEGKIQTTQTSVYIPGSLAERFRDPSLSAKQADEIMRRLKPFVLEQMRIELETQLLYLMGELRFRSIMDGEAETRVKTRDELMDRLKRTTRPEGQGGTAMDIVSNALTTVWKERDMAGPIDVELQRELPLTLQMLAKILPSKIEKIDQAAE